MNEPSVDSKISPEGTETTINISQASIRIMGTYLEVWHLLNHEVFDHLVRQFNKDHPRLNSPSGGKQKLIKYVNKKFNLRVAFKSKEAFMRHLAEQTTKLNKST